MKFHFNASINAFYNVTTLEIEIYDSGAFVKKKAKETFNNEKCARKFYGCLHINFLSYKIFSFHKKIFFVMILKHLLVLRKKSSSEFLITTAMFYLTLSLFYSFNIYHVMFVEREQYEPRLFCLIFSRMDVEVYKNSWFISQVFII